jgi:DNA-directed RNA polymerase subunit RPC12/RpoP
MGKPSFEDHPITLAAFGRAETSGVLRVRLWPPRDRALRVLKGLLACWALAGLTVFIPIAHFVLVPGFFLGGIFLAARWSRQARTPVVAHGACPACGDAARFEVRGRFERNKEAGCPACGGRVMLKPSPPPDGPPEGKGAAPGGC